MKLRRFLLSILFALMICWPLAAQQPAAPAQPAPDIKPVLAELERAGGLKEHPNANALVVFEDDGTVFEESGEFTATEHSLVKILTDKGKQTFATRKLPYHRRYSSVKVSLARVIKKDGRAVPVPPESMKDGTMEDTQAMNIFEENFRRLSVTFPGLEVGDAVEIIVETHSKPLIQGHYNDLAMFQSIEPVLRNDVIIDGPASKPLRFVVRDGKLEFSEQKKNGRIIYHWRAVNMPKIEQELAMASIADVATRVIASTFKDWKELSRYGASLNVGKIDANDAMRAKVAELTKDCATREDKILAIFRYVSQKIRYMGSSMDLGAFIEPHQATYTFEKQYGVCRDKSILMMAMLKEIGVEAYDAMINVSRSTDPEIPIIFFEHAICGVVMDDGRIVYMDPTLELSSSFGEGYVGGRYVLLMDERGRDLVRVPPVPAEQGLGSITGETRVLPDGSIQGKVRVSGKGFYDYVLRTIAKQIPSFQFPMVWQQLGQNLATTIKVENVKPGEFADLTKPYEISFEYKAKDYAVDVGRLMMFRIPFSTQAFDIISVGIFQLLADREERKYPIFLFAPRGCRQEETIAIPQGYRIKAVPDPVTIREGPVSLTLTTALRESGVVFTSDFRIEAASLDPQGYQGLRKVVKGLRRFQKSMVILEKVEAGAAGGAR
jgi:transglutaminase-like putative cysteine protease